MDADAHAADWQLAVHAIGDAAMDLALDGFEAGAARNPAHRGRHRIEHGGLIRDDHLPRLAALGITVVSQPSFIYDSADDFARQLGPDRADHLYRGRSLLDPGVRIVGSTDRPLPGSPLRAVQTLVERRTRSGSVIGPKEPITVEEAFATVTTHADPDHTHTECVMATGRAATGDHLFTETVTMLVGW